MSDHIRTFIGVPIQPTESLRAVLELLSGKRRFVKPVDSDTMHVTIKFIGNMRQELVQPVADILVHYAGRMDAMDLPIRGLDAFPNRSKPSIMWAAFLGAEPVRRFASDLESALLTLGIEPETRPYRPHLTLARLRRTRARDSQGPEIFRRLLTEYKETNFGTAALRHAVLYQSELTESGPIYTSLAQADFRSS